ncbi:MAG: polymer-forming cytoskeletal protein [Gracilibacteraceae bacterium]|nr:polymer-forming cytoskeletal protein [Gracilibacteraceae bacterium]
MNRKKGGAAQMGDDRNTGLSLLIIPADAQLTGSIVSAGSVRIEGRLEGEIKIQGDLTLGVSAEIAGSVAARNASIGGRVDGDVTVSNLLEITATGTLRGDILTKDLAIERGGSFVGANRHHSISDSPPLEGCREAAGWLGIRD